MARARLDFTIAWCLQSAPGTPEDRAHLIETAWNVFEPNHTHAC